MTRVPAFFEIPQMPLYTVLIQYVETRCNVHPQ